MGNWMVLLIFISFPFGAGLLAGYFWGRRAGRQQAQQGFPVLPIASQDNAPPPPR